MDLHTISIITIQKIIGLFKTNRAFFTNKVFECKTLNGDSSYNMVVNCDSTVSCNCNDGFGLGLLGSLETKKLDEIFWGDKATNFRKKLSNGKLPIMNCSLCHDLKYANKNQIKKSINSFKFPQALMLENTANCNLNCVSCDRKRIYSLRKKKTINLEEIKKIAKELSRNKVKFLYYFNLGEPFMSDHLPEELKIIKSDNPEIKIRLSTNGTLVNSPDKIEAALLLDRITFSLDGSDQKTLQKYQKGGNFWESYNNMKNLVTARNELGKTKPLIIWKYVLFRWNDNKKNIEEAIKLARDAGVDIIYFEKTLSPLHGISYKSYLGMGYLNKHYGFKGKTVIIKL